MITLTPIGLRGSARPNRIGATELMAGYWDRGGRYPTAYCFRRIPAHASSDGPPAFPSVSSSSP